MRRACVLLFVLLCLGAAAFAQDSPPDTYTEKVDAIADLLQRDANLQGGGAEHCGPTAVANALMWLSDHGYPGLVPEDTDNSDVPASTRLINGLSVFMTTNKGTNPLNTMAGLDQYCTTMGYQATIQWQGWRDGGKYAVAKRPDPRWVFEGVRGVANAVLELGYYRYRRDTDSYEKTGGHWVTLVGYRHANSPRPEIIIHNPARGGGSATYPLVPIESGLFIAQDKLPARAAAGWLILGGYRPVGADVAVLEGAFRFRVDRPKPTPGVTFGVPLTPLPMLPQ